MEISRFTNYYLGLVKSYGFELLKVKERGERFAKFINKQFEVTFEHLIFFNRSGTIDFFVIGENEIITSIYNKLNGIPNTKELYLFSANLRSYLNPVNKGGFSNRAMGDNNQYNFFAIQSEEKTKEFAETIFKEVFNRSVPGIIEETNSLEKLEKVLNPNPQVFDLEGDPKKRVHTSSLPDQLLVGLLLAKYLKRENFDELLHNYSGFINKFSPGDVLEIDLIKQNFIYDKFSMS